MCEIGIGSALLMLPACRIFSGGPLKQAEKKSIEELVSAIHKGAITPEELVTYFLNRSLSIEKNQRLNSFATLLSRAEQAAFSKAKPIAEQKLAGIPIAVKDNIFVDGFKTVAGSSVFLDGFSGDEATIIKRLKDQGAVIIGKTNLDELALGFTGQNDISGVVRNPLNTFKMAGGSSSGSASAVAAGQCVAAIGTDTGGSIRVPCSLTGLFGLRPTHGRIDHSGILPLSPMRDTVGPMTKRASDLDILYRVMSEKDEEVVTVKKNLKMAVVGNYLQFSGQPISKSFEKFTEQMKSRGHTLRTVKADFLKEASRISSGFFFADFDRTMEKIFSMGGKSFNEMSKAGELSERLKYYLHKRNEAKNIKRDQLVTDRRQLIKKIEELFADNDFLLLPCHGRPAPGIRMLSKPVGQYQSWFNRHYLRFGVLSSVSGFPALVVPGPPLEDGMANGIQVIAKPDEDLKLLAWARREFP